jgi:hypothetical protein
VTLGDSSAGTFAQSTIGTGISVITAMTISGTNEGNYTLTQPAITGNITTKTLTVTGAVAQNKSYDRNETAVIEGATLVGKVDGDDVTLANCTTGTFAQTGMGINIAVATLPMTITGTAIGNYTLIQPSGLKANITAKELTVTGAVVTSKVYAGNAYATITGAALSGVVSPDAVTLANATSGTFAQTGVGTGITVTPAMTLSGANAGNYTLTQPTLTGDITGKSLTVTGASVNTKVYDGNTDAVISGATLSGVVGSDAVTLDNASSGTFAQSTVGDPISVSIAPMSISGAQASNYTLIQPVLTGIITTKELTVSGAVAQNKQYSGDNAATISGATLVGNIDGGNVILANCTTGTFAQTALGTDIVVTTLPMTITGSAIGNYTLTQPTGLKANITTKVLTVTLAGVTSKVYDGTPNATITGATLTGVVGTEVVLLGNASAGNFAQSAIGTGVAVTTAMTLSGTNASNYTLTQPTLTGNITAKELTVTGAAAQNKAYDRNNTAQISGAILVGIIGEEDVALANYATGTFAQTGIGTNIAVATLPMTITGSDIGNYTLTQPTGLTANITAKELTVTGAAVTAKVYDGNTTAAITGAVLSGVVSPDNLTLGSVSAGTFAQSTIGTGISVTTAMTFSGTNSGNYTLTQPTLTGDITAKELTITGVSVTAKTYDGNTTAVITGATLAGVVNSDAITLGNETTGTFARATIGTGISVATAPMTISGDKASNYTLTQPTLSGNITAKTLTVTGASVTSKTYNGNTTASITGATLSGVVDADDVTLGNKTSGTFARATIGTGISVATAPMTISGSKASNYVLTQPTLTGNITAKELTVTGASVETKTYDGNTTATISWATLSGVAGTDDITLGNKTSGTFDNASAGTGKTVTSAMTISGTNVANYTLTQPTLSGDIAAKELTVTGAVAQNKAYNGNNTAQISGATLVGRVGLDDVALTNHATGTFAQTGIGTDIAVATLPMIITGAAIGNYTLIQPTDFRANITAKALTITGAGVTSKVYDGTDIATITGAVLTGVVGTEVVDLGNSGTGTFAQSTIGTGIAVTSAMTISGTNVANYTLTQPALTGNITAKELTVTGAVAQSKDYDGNNTAQISGAILVGKVGDDNVTLANHATGTFAHAGIGTDIAVATLPMTITGADIGNYTLTQPTGLKANITAKELYVTGAVAQDKIYNNNQVAQITGATLVGVVSPDRVSLANYSTGTFAQAGIGTDIAVTTLPMTITGLDIGNYTLTQPTGLKASITAKELTITGAAVTSKIYDGNTDATITGATLSGVASPDALTLGAASTGTFAQSTLGMGIAVTTAMTISGTNSGNYTLTQPTLTGNITVKDLTITAVNQSKVYGTEVTFNGTTPSSDFTVSGLNTGDLLAGITLSSAGADATATTAGSPYAIIPSRATGLGLDNYHIVYTNGTMVVNSKTLIIAAVDKTKTYGATYTFNRVSPPNDFTVTGLEPTDAISGITLTCAGAAAAATVAG